MAMASIPAVRTFLLSLSALSVLILCSSGSHAQAALLLEEPYGFFGTLNPTGHNAVYFDRICAETPIKLRCCEMGEPGAVIARYQGIAGYDWVAIPLVPYLYSVDSPAEVSAPVDRRQVAKLRNRYHEAHLLSLGRRFLRATSCEAAGLSFWALPMSAASLLSGLKQQPNRTTP